MRPFFDWALQRAPSGAWIPDSELKIIENDLKIMAIQSHLRQDVQLLIRISINTIKSIFNFGTWIWYWLALVSSTIASLANLFKYYADLTHLRLIFFKGPISLRALLANDSGGTQRFRLYGKVYGRRNSTGPDKTRANKKLSHSPLV